MYTFTQTNRSHLFVVEKKNPLGVDELSRCTGAKPYIIRTHVSHTVAQHESHPAVRRSCGSWSCVCHWSYCVLPKVDSSLQTQTQGFLNQSESVKALIKAEVTTLAKMADFLYGLWNWRVTLQAIKWAIWLRSVFPLCVWARDLFLPIIIVLNIIINVWQNILIL